MLKLSTTQLSFLILRIGLAITFIWIGILILQVPENFGAFIQPWAQKLLPTPLRETMIATGFLDIGIGILLLVPRIYWIGGLLGTVHLLVVIVTSGINDVTVRDIGLLAAAIAVTIYSIANFFNLTSRKF